MPYDKNDTKPLKLYENKILIIACALLIIIKLALICNIYVLVNEMKIHVRGKWCLRTVSTA